MLKNKLKFPAVTLIPSYFIDNYFYFNIANNYDQTELKKKILKNTKTWEEFQNKYSGYHNFIVDGKIAGQSFETHSRYVEIMQENSLIDWFQQQYATWNNKRYVNFTMTRTFYGMAYTFNLLNTENILKYEEVNEEFHLDRNLSMLKQKSKRLKITKNQYPLKVGGSEHSKIELKITETLFDTNILFKCRSKKIIIHSPDLLPTFIDIKMIVNVPYSMNIEVKAEYLKTEESLRSQNPDERQCYFDGEKKLKYFKIYTQKHCEMECVMEHLFNVCKCQMIDSIYKQRKQFCILTTQECINSEKLKILHEKTNLNDNCTCLPSCNLLKYHVKYNQVQNEGNESVITVKMNGEDFILFRRYQQFTLSDIVSYVGGLLRLFAGISVLSIIEVFYFMTFRLINEFVRL